MPSSTPFFDAFGSLLFGRPARSLRDQLCAKLRTESISELQEAFGSMIHEVLLCPQQNGIGSRQRRFSPLLTFWAFLSQVISPNSSCREAVRKVQAWWALRALQFGHFQRFITASDRLR